MKLGLHNHIKSKIDSIRDLSEEEVSAHNTHTKVATEAQNRLALFRMLDTNYKEFRDFVDILLSATHKDDGHDGENLDRLLLNYLTFAYSIQCHFEVSFNRRNKKDKEAMLNHSEFLDRLCKACWPFAFILDFRGFVQHVGLGVGIFKRNVNRSSVTVRITADPKILTRESRDWKKSGLKPESPPVDLIDILHEFHIQMIQSYGSYVAKAFFPELVPASEFYLSLTEEVKRRDSEARMVFIENDPEVIDEGGGKKLINLNLILPPNDLFDELGIQHSKPKKEP